MTDRLTPNKITSAHLDRLAVVYVRQSHPQQQVRHPESVAVQRRLVERIREWGWPPDRIQVLEGDVGKSGTSTVGRDDFQWLLNEVTLDHVGLVAGFQINRLAREDETVCRLIKLCAGFNTLLADQDGLYHPLDFNDRLVLTIKGVVGGVELHQIQQRMQHGRLERARRGEWLGATPMGYVPGDDRRLAFDPDEQVQHTVRQVFECFERLGSVSAVLRHFHGHDLRLPIRVTHGPAKGRIEWRPPHRETLRNVLRHPAYAGAFTWGRRTVDPRRAVEGRRGAGVVHRAPRDCMVFLPDNHAAYITWQRFEQNVERLSSHRRHGPQPSAAREAVSLLTGRVICGHCGARMQTHYAPQLRYECARRSLDYGEPRCGSFSGTRVEQLVQAQLLRALEPASLELSLAAAEQIEARQAEVERGWRLRLERAEQEVNRAFRQYDAVEPENRLVARTLEARWEAALSAARSLQEDYDRFCAQQPAGLTGEQRQAILDLAHDLPRLWHAETTAVADRRRIVQLLLSQAVVRTEGERVGIDLHWAGGAVTHHELVQSVQSWKHLSTFDEIVEQIRQQTEEGLSSQAIAESLNGQGYRTPRGREFRSDNIRQLRTRTEKSENPSII